MRNQTFINCSYSMKKFLFIPALCLLFASCGGDKGTDGGGVPSLKVEPSSLDFAAVSAPSQSVTVTAVNVEWEVRVSDTASAWLKAEKTDGTTVTVSVTDNGTPEQRTGSFTVVPTNNEDVKAKSVTVVQTGSDVEYKFSVEPVSLTFEAEGAAAQTVTITAEGGLTWEAEAEGDAASWITVTPGEGTLEVKVSDNPETAERSGNIVVTPSAESVGAKAIRVTQAGKVLPPSLSINVEDPETGLHFRANGAASDAGTIRVTAVNTDWNARAVDAEGNAVTWFSVAVNKEDGLSSIGLTVTKNETYEERVGYVVITATVEGVPEIRVTVTQDAALEHLSTLTEDADVSGMTHAYGGLPQSGQGRCRKTGGLDDYSDDGEFDHYRTGFYFAVGKRSAAGALYEFRAHAVQRRPGVLDGGRRLRSRSVCRGKSVPCSADGSRCGLYRLLAGPVYGQLGDVYRGRRIREGGSRGFRYRDSYA